MDSSEAERLIIRALEDEIPSPQMPMTKLKVARPPRPGSGFGGVRIQGDTSGYLAFGHIQPDFMKSSPNANLREVFPDVTKIRRYDPDSEYLQFLRNGALLTTVSLKVADRPLFQLRERQWVRVQELEKGGYVWNLGALGVVLRGKETEYFIPMTGESDYDGSLPDKRLVFIVEISVSRDEGKPGILIEAPGDPVRLQ